MINSKIIQTLKPLNTPIYWMEYDGDSSEYIIFNATSITDEFHSDDNSDVEMIDVSLCLWYKDAKSSSKIKELKQLMKNNKFIKISEKDMRDGNYYGRSFLFRYFEGL